MIKTCPACGKTFETEYPSKIYCNKNCADIASRKRDVDFYNYEPDTKTPYYSFDCAECGRHVDVMSKYDQRSRFCCGKCQYAYNYRLLKMRRSKHRPTNLGMSGGMSLGSLIRRERRDLD